MKSLSSLNLFGKFLEDVVLGKFLDEIIVFSVWKGFEKGLRVWGFERFEGLKV